ncbi:MAG: nitrite reductase large subunit NirB [Myxococcota bacterium]
MAGKIVMSEPPQPQRIVVIGNGMVGWKFCDRLTVHDQERRYRLLVFGEEPRPAYDRVQLTSYFDHRSVDELTMAPREWYTERAIDLRTSERVASIDPANKELTTTGGEIFGYDILVLATGSSPFVPPIDGVDKEGVFVYRTIEDLEGILARAESRGGCCAVLGGGLLGLEAARAVQGCGLDTHVVELASRLMPRQLDDSGGRLLRQEIEKLGVNVHVGRSTARIDGDDHATALVFDDEGSMDVDMVVVSAGIRPRDELARAAGVEVGRRGGIVVDDHLATSAADVYAIGEVALHDDKIYGLVAPGYDMAEVLAKRLTDQHATFESGDLSAKLKLMGVDVASFGNPFADQEPTAKTIEYQDLVKGVYKKIIVDEDGKRLLGGMLVGDASEYGQLLHYARSGDPLPDEPEALIVGVRGGEAASGGVAALPDGAQICSCNNVSKGDICARVRDDGLTTVAEIKACTTAGTGCGGCVPMVADLLDVELAARGVSVRRRLCEHFDYTRQELFDLIRLKQIRTFDALIAEYGEGHGCEICKPTAASCFASLFNALILEDHTTLQDTNDRFLANIQRRGLYSVIPRVPGGEITPDKLIRLGEIAKKYDLYTKITGGQRIDLLGAKLNQLPDVWEDLVAAGFESGHAYAKGIRTVKSCVGSTWCRYGVDDSIGLSIRIEERYRGIRSPHKLKSAVSGCVRECAEAQSKDFGIIATENGWNLYVCGNGGAKPRHADLLASDLDEETLIRYIDRFLIYYIRTADKLTRTSTWVDKIDGGIEHVRDVVVNDSLGLAEELERDMQYLVDTYQCEWAAVVNDPEQRRKFRHFANDDSDDDTVFRIEQRGQRRPADWDKRPAPSEPIKLQLPVVRTDWVKAGRVEEFPVDGGMSIKHGRTQVAVFHFASRGEWYAVQNMCPHMQDMVLARGILGDKQGEPKVACPLHKKNFSLKTGECLSGESYRVHTFPVRVEDGQVYVELPPAAELETHLCPKTPGDCVEAAQ